MTSPSKPIRVIGARPVHPRQGEGDSYIEFSVQLEYLKGSPLTSVRMDREEAIFQAERLLTAYRNTRPRTE